MYICLLHIFTFIYCLGCFMLAASCRNVQTIMNITYNASFLFKLKSIFSIWYLLIIVIATNILHKFPSAISIFTLFPFPFCHVLLNEVIEVIGLRWNHRTIFNSIIQNLWIIANYIHYVWICWKLNLKWETNWWYVLEKCWKEISRVLVKPNRLHMLVKRMWYIPQSQLKIIIPLLTIWEILREVVRWEVQNFWELRWVYISKLWNVCTIMYSLLKLKSKSQLFPLLWVIVCEVPFVNFLSDS